MADERDTEVESGEERIDAEGRNPTQQQMDAVGVDEAPVDASWTEEGEGEGEGAPLASGANEPVFEPDVPLVAEVNREAGTKHRKGIVAAVAGAFALVVAVVLRRRR